MDSVILLESILLHEYDRYLHDLSAGDIVIDIGAHIGDFCIPVAVGNPLIRVIGIEPHPRTYHLLCKNIESNAAKNILALPLAITDANGTTRLSLDPGNSGGNSTMRSMGGSSIDVRSLTLEHLFKKYSVKQCKFLKMDCEGAEYDIIRAAPESLLRSVDTIVMEYHHNGPIGELAEKLRKCEFTITLTSGITNPLLKPFVHTPFCIAVNQQRVV